LNEKNNNERFFQYSVVKNEMDVDDKKVVDAVKVEDDSFQSDDWNNIELAQSWFKRISLGDKKVVDIVKVEDDGLQSDIDIA